MVLNNLKYNTMKKLLLVATFGVAGFMSANTGSKELKVSKTAEDLKSTIATCTRCVSSTTTNSDGTTTTVQYCYSIKCYEVTLPN